MSRSRSRSRSSSPSSNHKSRVLSERQSTLDNERMEEQRRMRMARLRSENDEEEKKMEALDEVTKRRKAGLEFQETSTKKKTSGKDKIIEVNEEDLQSLNENEKMQHLLGFSGGFATTHNSMVADNQKKASRGIVAKNKARKYRQYMNRKGGFNRPLAKMK